MHGRTNAVQGPATVIPRQLRTEADEVLIPWGCTLIVPEIVLRSSVRMPTGHCSGRTSSIGSA